MPYNYKVIKNSTVNSDIHKAWAKFGELREIGTTYPSEMPTDLAGTPDFKTIFMENIWPENGNMHELLVDLSKRSNDGIVKKFEVNKNLKREDYIIKDYDVSRK